MGTSKKLFISRNLSKESPIWKLKNEGFEIFHQSLIRLESIEVAEIPETDWVFFYSKNAFDYFLRQAKSMNYRLEEKKIAVIGTSTGDYIKQEGYEVTFCGTGHGDTTALQFVDHVSSESVLFPRAKQSLNSVASNLPRGLKVVELIVYNNMEKDPATLPAVDVVLLTSPINARVFFRNYHHEPHPVVIAIGRSTASEVVNHGQGPLFMAAHPTEESMIDAIPKNLR